MDDETYWKRQAACECLLPKRREFIKDTMDFAKDFPDGAFFAYMEENGVDVSELEPFSIDHHCSENESNNDA